ncbi:hypothetical protein RJ639_035356 [Escallonia herrerae]|uniref:Protein kinase domain-containing protein n=1 Tax=Escallonia herrerae TaxID=1293975 RepID=A0AA89B689_9ASTE|nr:hypothetical protein RJ639_035356 [Escallonia herrerae]
MYISRVRANPHKADSWQSVGAFFDKLSHPNLLRHFGYCLEEEKHFLVHEFMENGRLDTYLSDGAKPLPWVTRLNIAVGGAAQGLAFLHATEKRVMYFSFMASKILLDGDFNAKLFGFGLNFECDNKFYDFSEYYHPNVRFTRAVAPEYCDQPCFRKFSFAELQGITKNFSMDLVLGEGGFGMNFKGAINEVTYSPSKKPEVAHFQKLIHPNLVKLFGYCLEGEEFLLVYEYMKHGSLDNYLFKDDADAALPWATRLKIAIGAAQGLAFLHTIIKQLVYFDFKASNVLLDKDFNAKLCDFGLAELDHLANNNVDHNDVGSSYSDTKVYTTYSVAPEYLESVDCVMIFMKLEISDAGEWNMKRDVHGFGFILLQLLTCQKIDRKHTPGSVDWAEVARIYLSNEKKLVTIMDARLEHKYPSRGALEVAELTLKCLEVDPKKRPSMKEVLKTLERISAIKMETMKEEVRG